MLTRQILEDYRKKNPVKYLQKFGNKSIEELLGQVQPVTVEETAIKAEIVEKENVEIGFTEKPKRTRKLKV